MSAMCRITWKSSRMPLPPMSSYMASPWSGVEDVRAGRVDERPQAAAAEVWRGRLLGAAPVAEPRQQAGPPAALLRLGGRQPVRRAGRGALVVLVAGLRVAWRVHQRGDVTTSGQDELAVTAEELGTAVAVL